MRDQIDHHRGFRTDVEYRCDAGFTSHVPSLEGGIKGKNIRPLPHGDVRFEFFSAQIQHNQNIVAFTRYERET